jgi:hypothetical protein
MKTLKILAFVFSSLIIMAISIASYNTQKVKEVSFMIPDEIKTGKVLGIHYYKLKEGVSPLEFERFVTEEWSPVNNELFPGILIRLMKGERGSKVGHYIMIYEMNSLKIRNFYFPTRGEKTEEAFAIIEKCGEQCTQVWNRFDELAERTEYTDYVELLKK